MSNNSPLSRARYDDAGNIILEGAVIHEEKIMTTNTDERVRRQKTPQWSITEEATPKAESQKVVTHHITQNKKKRQEPSLLACALQEGREQIHATRSELRSALSSASAGIQQYPSRGRGIIRSFWKAAKSPVTLPGKKRRKPRSKMSLFFIDAVKFGGTFAAIFITLFTVMNYQSFTEIVVAELALGNNVGAEQALQNIGQDQSSNTQKATVSSFDKQGSLLAYLPSVGPYENRIVVPKIGKNLPVVRPSMEGLMTENWKQFEDDIQAALHDGVVHYPGSARPGQAGNAFFTAHSSYYFWSDSKFKDAFARLHELALGDTYFIYYGGDKHVYRVIGKKEVKPTDVSVLDQPTDKRLSTLMTCTPLGTTLRRLVITAEEIDPATGIALHVGEQTEKTNIAHLKNIEALPI